MCIRDMVQLVGEKVAKGKIQVRYDIQNRFSFGYVVSTVLHLSR